MGMTLRKIASEDALLWDGLIEASPQGSIFFRDGCLSVWVASEPGLHMLRYGCFDPQGCLVAGQVFLYRKKVFGFRVQTSLNFPYNSSPILAGSIRRGGPEYTQILQALAKQADRLFPFFSFDCHPSLQDIRPFLEIGWRAIPEYAHTWDLHDPEELLQRLSQKRQFRRAGDSLDRLAFAEETTAEVLAAFPAMYQQSAHRYKMDLERSWAATFAARIEWMLRQDAVRCFTCRKRDGTLLGILVPVVSQTHRTAQGWMLAYDLSLGEKTFLRALYLYALRQHAQESVHVDIGRGLRPALYEFKDSLGTESTLYFIVESPRTDFCSNIFKIYRHAKSFLTKASR